MNGVLSLNLCKLFSLIIIIAIKTELIIDFLWIVVNVESVEYSHMQMWINLTCDIRV